MSRLRRIFGIFIPALVIASAAQAASLAVGQPAPGFTLPDQQGLAHSLSEWRGKWLVLYFYPKDDTPGCTTEACAFRDDWATLQSLGAQVVGVSVDSSDSHAKFAEKYHLPFPLLADPKGEVAYKYGAVLNLAVVKFAKRHTFLIDPQGKLAKIYRDVKASEHSDQIIADLKALQAAK
jgi:peroxiredoxin Q/BCP